MNSRNITGSLLFNELDFTASRSGGPGGQNVNKVETMVMGYWHVVSSTLVTEQQKALLLEKGVKDDALKAAAYWRQDGSVDDE